MGDVTQRILEVFPTDVEFMLTYVDCDSDTITISTVNEIREAVREGVRKFEVLFPVGGNDVLLFIRKWVNLKHNFSFLRVVIVIGGIPCFIIGVRGRDDHDAKDRKGCGTDQ